MIFQWKGHFAEVLNESAIKLGEVGEVLYILERSEWLDFLDGSYISVGYLDTVSGDDISKEFDAVLCPHALLRRNAEGIVSQAGKNFEEDLLCRERRGAQRCRP